MSLLSSGEIWNRPDEPTQPLISPGPKELPQPPQPERPPTRPSEPQFPQPDPDPVPTPAPGPTDPGLPRPALSPHRR